MPVVSYLSAREKAELVQFIAATGENYDRYLDYCSKRGWKPFSRKYLHTWIQRKREKVKVARDQHATEVRKMSTYDKERRIDDLERSVEVINSHILVQTVEDHDCTRCGSLHSVLSPDMVIKLMEQKRKLLEAIAKERNEWLKDTASKGVESTRDRLDAAITKVLAETKEAKVFDGTFKVVGDS